MMNTDNDEAERVAREIVNEYRRYRESPGAMTPGYASLLVRIQAALINFASARVAESRREERERIATFVWENEDGLAIYPNELAAKIRCLPAIRALEDK